MAGTLVAICRQNIAQLFPDEGTLCVLIRILFLIFIGECSLGALSPCSGTTHSSNAASSEVVSAEAALAFHFHRHDLPFETGLRFLGAFVAHVVARAVSDHDPLF